MIMKMTMIEKVAIAMGIAKEDWQEECRKFVIDEGPRPKHKTQYLAMAAAALSTIRDPSPAMQQAWLGPEPWDHEALEVYQAMIDAALKEE